MKMRESYKQRDTENIVEEETLVRDSNGTRIVPKGDESVRLSPDCRKNVKSDDESKEGALDQTDVADSPPRDRMYILYLIMVLHGIGVLIPWNVYLNSLTYFETSLNGTKYAKDSANWIKLSGLIPNLIFTWFNVFCHIGGNISVRIAWGLVVQAAVLVFSISMTMKNISNMQDTFFWLTIISVFILNIFNGFYQNSIYGLAAKLPGKYTGAIIWGSNLCGIFTTVVDIITKKYTQNYNVAATYYFIAALFFVLVCFDTFFALPLNRFYRYHEVLDAKQQKKTEVMTSTKVSYLAVIKQCWVQLLNVYLLFTVTLLLFPTILMRIQDPTIDKNDKEAQDDYRNYYCFLTFNATAFIGSLLATKIQWPNAKWLIVPISLRILFIPAFMFYCNYQFEGTKYIETQYHSNGLYLALSIAMGLTSGYFSSLAMVNCSKVVESRYASTAGMLAGAALSSGIFSGTMLGALVEKITFKQD